MELHSVLLIKKMNLFKKIEKIPLETVIQI